MSKYLHLFELQDLAESAKNTAVNSGMSSEDVTAVHKAANGALEHLETVKSHMRKIDSGVNPREHAESVAAINNSMAAAADGITAAHKLVSGRLKEDTPSESLDVAHLGHVQLIHQNILDELNEGLKNGR